MGRSATNHQGIVGEFHVVWRVVNLVLSSNFIGVFGKYLVRYEIKLNVWTSSNCLSI